MEKLDEALQEIWSLLHLGLAGFQQVLQEEGMLGEVMETRLEASQRKEDAHPSPCLPLPSTGRSVKTLAGDHPQ